MISSSFWRVATTAPQTQLPAYVTSTVPRCVATHSLSYRRSHQRRYSSSKPSSPADGPKGIAEGQEVATAPAQGRTEGEKKASGRASRRKAKDVPASSTVKPKDEILHNLPSVPSTQHVKGKDLAASAFFSLYRPISVTSSFPKPVTDEAFAAIFTQRTKANKPSDVISTLSNTVSKLETAAQQQRWNSEADELRAAIEAQSGQTDVRHLDADPSEIPFPQHILSGDYLPFQPPPPPRPRSEVPEPEAPAPQHRTYKAMLTIEETTDVNGEVTYMAHSGPLVAEVEEPETSTSIRDPGPLPTRFRDRMNIRQERYDESLRSRIEEEGEGGAAIWAISVKRQRKLKMKKHKYKKLMRRTRNLRRRLDRN